MNSRGGVCVFLLVWSRMQGRQRKMFEMYFKCDADFSVLFSEHVCVDPRVCGQLCQSDHRADDNWRAVPHCSRIACP